MMRKITVVTNEAGDVIGTQLGHGEPDPKTGMTTSLVAGPGQQLHRTEFDVPRLIGRADIENFHRSLTGHLRRTPA